MDLYVAEACFADKSDLRAAVMVYNAKARQFQYALEEIKKKHDDFLLGGNITLGVETVDNFETCTIKLKSLQPTLTGDIQNEIITAFNTIWSL
jgi:hypothetical protein